MTFTEIVQRARSADSETGAADSIQALWDALFALADKLDAESQPGED